MVDVAPCNNSGSPLVLVLGLSFFAVASGFLMSLIPLSLTANGLSSTLAPWLASIFYLGLLIGAFTIQRIVAITGHRIAFVACGLGAATPYGLSLAGGQRPPDLLECYLCTLLVMYVCV